MSSQPSLDSSPQQRSGRKHIHKRLRKYHPEHFHNTFPRVSPARVVRTKQSTDSPVDNSLNSSSVSPDSIMASYSHNPRSNYPEDLGPSHVALQEDFLVQDLAQEEHGAIIQSQNWFPSSETNATFRNQLQDVSIPSTDYWTQGQSNWVQGVDLERGYIFNSDSSLNNANSSLPVYLPATSNYNLGLNPRAPNPADETYGRSPQGYYGGPEGNFAPEETFEGVNNAQVFYDSAGASYF